jgi:N utilization substance protein A
LESALATSYRKNANIMASQNVAVKVDIENGDMRVFVEKEVVDVVMDDRTEISFEEAKQEKPDAEMGDLIMVDVTMKDFGRIAAQNVKQMIVQKLRDAERDFQYNTYAEREGEIVHGIVQSVNATSAMLNLGRAEGTLLRKEQIPGERLNPQQHVRAYVTEVKRTNRGPQIMLSRTHKNMLRRLLEIEVPEIQKGQVEIKSIAREAGSRSKVAVAALQQGIDPVGACVGQRGTRVQSIVNELNGEKIDVIEWNADPTVFITKALGPAKVLAVHPTLENKEQKSGTVIVPDDQLSLAIGREGQNARLAAKLTGWHIDIKSGSEALGEALVRIAEDERLREWVGHDIVQAVPMLRELLVRQRAMPVPLSADEFLAVKRILDSVYAYAVQSAKAVPEAKPEVAVLPDARREARNAALAAIPRQAYGIPVEQLGLSPRVMQHIIGAGVLSVGQLMERRVDGDEGLLSIEGVGSKALAEIKASLDKVLEQYKVSTPAAPVAVEEPAEQAVPTPVTQAEVPAASAPVAPAPAVTPEAAPEVAAPVPVMAEALAQPEAAVGVAEVAQVAKVEEPQPVMQGPVMQAATIEAQSPEAVANPVEEAEGEGEGEGDGDDAGEEEEEERTPQQIFLEAMGQTRDADGNPLSPTTPAGSHGPAKKKDKDKGKKGSRDRVLVFDEELGRTVVQRSRKPGRASEFLDEDEEF